MIAFSSEPRRWRRAPERAAEPARRAALAWLDGLQAGGSTEMREAITRALRPLRGDAQRQVLLVTDGLIGFEREIVAAVAQDLPGGSRLHTVGVGSSVNRALTAPAARAGRGLEVVLGVDEAVTRPVARLLAATQAPVLIEVTLSGSALLGQAPTALPYVCAGAPLRAALELSPDGGDLVVRGRTSTGVWEDRLAVPAHAPGQGTAAVVSLYGREAVEDLEVRSAAGDRAVDAEIERLGLEFQIATRLTSWVAVASEPIVPFASTLMGSDVLSVRPRFRARLVLRKGRALTFEIAAATIFEWEPRSVMVVWPDGTTLTAQIVEPHTTARGPVPDGGSVRLAIELGEDGPAGMPKRLVIVSPGKTVRVPVRGA